MDASGPEDCAPPGMLVWGHHAADELRTFFYRMGFNDGEIVALSGAHTLGRCHPQHSGLNGPWTTQPLSFDNHYYISLLNSNYSFDGSQWNANDGTM